MKQNSTNHISIIIPVLNEEKCIGQLLDYLTEHNTKYLQEIIVVDGGSTDATPEIVKEKGLTVLRSSKGRAQQMNLGARHASGNILYFLHVDTIPPSEFDGYISKAIGEGFSAGCFRMKFDRDHWFLSFFASLSKINHKVCRGGDQSLFVTKALFKKLGGFNEDYIIYEDSEFIGRLYQTTRFQVLPHTVITSARKYHQIGIFRLQYHFGVIHLKKYFGAGPDQLYDYYKRKIVI